MPDFAHLQHTWLSFISLSQPSPSIQLSQRRACRLSPLVPTRSLDHRLRFCLPAHGLDFDSAELSFGRRAHACSGRCAFLTVLFRGLQAWVVLCPLIGSTGRSLSS